MFDSRNPNQQSGFSPGDDSDFDFASSLSLSDRFDMGFLEAVRRREEIYSEATLTSIEPEKGHLSSLQNWVTGQIAKDPYSPLRVRVHLSDKRMSRGDDGSEILSCLFRLDDGESRPAVFDGQHAYLLAEGETRLVVTLVRPAAWEQSQRPHLFVHNLFCPRAFQSDLDIYWNPKKIDRWCDPTHSVLYRVVHEALSHVCRAQNVPVSKEGLAPFHNEEGLWMMMRHGNKGVIGRATHRPLDCMVDGCCRAIEIFPKHA